MKFVLTFNVLVLHVSIAFQTDTEYIQTTFTCLVAIEIYLNVFIADRKSQLNEATRLLTISDGGGCDEVSIKWLPLIDSKSNLNCLQVFVVVGTSNESTQQQQIS
jgi:hypothetical protein